MMELALSPNVTIVIGMVLLILNTMTMCTAIHDHRQLDPKQHFMSYDQGDCPPWFYFDWDTNTCQCLSFYGARCFDNKAYLSASFCATFDTDTKILSLGKCPYHGFNLSRQKGRWYIQLPDNVSELSDYMCGLLNRKGRVCSECMDGYGFAATSVGFQYFECSKCAGAWYGVPLFLFLELFPLTLLYLVILLFQINITSGSITCFIFYSQLLVIALDRVFAGDDPEISNLILTVSEYSEWFFMVIITIYDVWNLRFFRNVVPSFCISGGLKSIHISILDYISVVYPLCLICLTWIFIELYDRKYRLLVWLWKPFQRCFKGKQYTIDFINVFASFFLLSFTKVMYQALLLFIQRKIENKQFEDNYFTYFLGYTYVVGVDQSVIYGSIEHLHFIIPAAILCFFLSVLPATFLTLYPFRPFRALFSKCRLDGIVVNTFVEKFYSCYRTGLDGGRDMRSFAGLYFFARLLLFLSNLIASVLNISSNDPFFVRGIILTITALLVALCRPYTKIYMNILDTILLLNFGLLCHLVSAEMGFPNKKSLAITFEVMVMLPLLCCVLFFAANSLRLQKRFRNLTKAYGVLYRKCKSCYSMKFNNTHHVDCPSTFDSPSIQQVLIEPNTIENTYGSVDYY